MTPPGVYAEDGPAVCCWPTLRAAPGVSPAPCRARSPRSRGQMSHPGVGESRRQDRSVLVDWFHAGPKREQREPMVDRAAGPRRPPRRGTEDTPARRQVGLGAGRRAQRVCGCTGPVLGHPRAWAQVSAWLVLDRETGQERGSPEATPESNRAQAWTCPGGERLVSSPVSQTLFPEAWLGSGRFQTKTQGPGPACVMSPCLVPAVTTSSHQHSPGGSGHHPHSGEDTGSGG